MSSILQYANLNRGDSFTPSTVDLEETVRDVLEARQVEIEEVDGVVEVGELPTAIFDSVQAFRVVDNIIGNAIKYRAADRPLRINVSGSVEGSTATLNIADNGMGFDQAQHETVFTMFQRLHPNSKADGSGMGLAITRRVVEQYGGTISAESAPGIGSVFTVRIPTA